MQGFEVGIIGAGIHGASAAYHLGGRGIRTLIIERAAPAAGPTGRSSGICRAFYTNLFLAAVARDSIEMFRHFGEVAAGRDAAFRETGALYLHGHEDLLELNRAIRRLSDLGIGVELIADDALPRHFPALDPEGVAVGAWEPGAGHADPAMATTALFDVARDRGVIAKLGRRVIGIVERRGGGAVIECDDGERFECERLLIAAGPWSKALAGMVGVELPLTVERHWVSTFRWGDAEPLRFILADLPGGYYSKPEGNELFCLGPLTEEAQVDPDSFSENVTEDESLQLAQAMIRRVPDAVEAQPRGGWASLYDVSPDWQPVIGEIGDGIFIDAGTSGHGFKLAPVLGRFVADLLQGKPTDPELKQFSPRRFGDGIELSSGYGEIKILG